MYQRLGRLAELLAFNRDLGLIILPARSYHQQENLCIRAPEDAGGIKVIPRFPLPHLKDTELLRLLLQLGVLLLVARTFADLMKRVGGAPVIGELVAGIVLGPSVLGKLAPPLFTALFPADQPSVILLGAFAWIGAVMLLLSVGLETDLKLMRSIGRTAMFVSSFGVTLSFLLGLGLGFTLPDSYLADPAQRTIFALFVAIALSISAVPVIARILTDLGLMRRELGTVILAAGMMDDTVGWLLLSLVAGLAKRRRIGLVPIGELVGPAVLFLAFCYFVGFRLVTRWLRWIDDRTYAEHAKLTAMIVVALICAAVTQAIGLHAVFGAFIAGLMLAGSARVRKVARDDVEALTTGFMGPIFFAFSGLQVNLGALGDPLIPVLVLASAFAAKFVGCGLGGLLGGLHWREALAVAIGMNARGGMGIIVALVGLSLGVLSPPMYAVLITVALATSLATPPLLSWSLRGVRERPGDLERLERQRIEAQLPLKGDGTKLLVLSGGGPNAILAAHIAATLARHDDASVTVFHADVPGASAADFDAQFIRIKETAALSGARNVHQRLGSADSISAAIAEESGRDYDAVFAGASQVHRNRALGGDVLREIVAAARAPVVIVRDGGAPTPLRRVLVPITGAPFSRMGAGFAMLYARATGAAVTALYVRERSFVSLAALIAARHRPVDGEQVVAEIKSLGQQLGLEIETRIASGSRPENIILRIAEETECDLLVMGALFRSAEQRLYFGPRVEHILRRARCAVAVVIPPERGGAASG
jgi:Kef-type K+ transport system membrane component KefB